MLNWFRGKNKDKKSGFLSNEEWVEGLSEPADEEVVHLLRKKLVRGLKPALSKYVDRELESFVEDVAQDAVLKIMNHVDTFRGESKFLTWAMKIAVREGLTELRRKRYDDLSIEDFRNPDEGQHELSTTIFASDRPEPDEATHEQMVLEKILSIIGNDLTDKQKKAIEALMIKGLSITVVAEKMDTNRNALYKLVHDARMKIKSVLEEEGIDPDKLLNEL